MTPALPDLDAFVTVARHQSFARAAKERGVSRSALSHAMRLLEERIGVRLLNRTTRSVTLTDAGERLLARVGPALGDIAGALDEVNAFRDTPIGTLRLNVPRAAVLVLGPLIGPFRAAYPQIKIEIATDDGFVDIVGKRFDAGIRFDESLARDMIAVPIGPKQRFAVVGSPDYLRGRGVPSTPHELHSHECIGRRFPSGALFAWEFEKDGNALEVKLEGALVLDDAELMIRAAEAGAGLAYVYEQQAKDALASGHLSRVLEDWCPAFPGFFLYYPSPTRRQMPAPLRVFIEMARTLPL